jgi:hypothetical protein
MNTQLYRLFSLVLLTALLVAGTGAVVNAMRSPEEPVQIQIAQSTGQEGEVTQATLDYLLEGAAGATQQPEVIRAVIVEGYALTTWLWGEAGGQTVLAHRETGWTILISGGGTVDTATLIDVGVSAEIAEQMIEQDSSGE